MTTPSSDQSSPSAHAELGDGFDQARYERGAQVLAAVDGDAGQRVVDALADIAPALARHIVAYGFGDVYARYWRHLGTGPKSFRLGRRVLYRRHDVERWLADHEAGDDTQSVADLLPFADFARSAGEPRPTAEPPGSGGAAPGRTDHRSSTLAASALTTCRPK